VGRGSCSYAPSRPSEGRTPASPSVRHCHPVVVRTVGVNLAENANHGRLDWASIKQSGAKEAPRASIWPQGYGTRRISHSIVTRFVVD
jgi:hypothetical protein